MRGYRLAILTGLSIGLGIAPSVEAQLFRKSRERQSSNTQTTPAQDIAPQVPSGKNAHNLLRNGLDYLDSYGDTTRALQYLREAVKYQNELTREERVELSEALTRATRLHAELASKPAEPLKRRFPRSVAESGVALRRTPSRLELPQLPTDPVNDSIDSKTDSLVQVAGHPENTVTPALELNPPTTAEPVEADPFQPLEPKTDEPASRKVASPPTERAKPNTPAIRQVTPASEAETLELTILPSTDAADPLDTAPIEREPIAPPQIRATPAPLEVSAPPQSRQETTNLVHEAVEPQTIGAEVLPTDNTNRLPVPGATSALVMPEIPKREPQRLQSLKEDRDLPPLPNGLESQPLRPSQNQVSSDSALPSLPNYELPAVNPSAAVDVEPALPLEALAPPDSRPIETNQPELPSAATRPSMPEQAVQDANLLPTPPPALPRPEGFEEELPALPGGEAPTRPLGTPDRMAQAPLEPNDPRQEAPAIDASEIRIHNPETEREIERLAQRQDEELLRNPPASRDSIINAPEEGLSDTESAPIPRAPSPTEARPINPIPVPDEYVPLEKRMFEPYRKYWAAAATCHAPLYFQDAVLERYGQTVEQALGPNKGRHFSYPLDDPRQSSQRNQLLQPAYSAGLFIAQMATWPINVILNPPWEAEYDLGYYRPGDPIPPDSYYWPKLGVGPPLRGMKY